MSALGSAERKGVAAFEAGEPRTANPYGDARTDRGSVTWARGFWRAWNRGWDAGDSGDASRLEPT